MRQTLSNYGIPEDMQQYLSYYGYHFNKKMYEYAVGKMKKKDRATGKKESLSPIDMEEFEKSLKRYRVDIPDNNLYDAAYLASMIEADFWGSSIEDEEHMARYSNRFQRMCDDEDNIREKIRAGMENMMKGHLYHVESRSERFGVDVYIRVEKVEWKDWTTLTVRGVGVDLDVNYNIIHVADACCDFPVWDAEHKPHSLNKPEDNYSGPLTDWHPVKHRHYDNTLPRLTEFADDNEVKEELMKRTFAI